jgi:hypothetical protein
MRKQLEFGARRGVAIVLGTSRNFKELSSLNERHSFFERLVAVEHPRFIMQYRRKKVEVFVERYAQVLGDAAGNRTNDRLSGFEERAASE